MRVVVLCALAGVVFCLVGSAAASPRKTMLYADRCCISDANVRASYSTGSKTVTVSWSVPFETNLGRDPKGDVVACQIYGGYTLSQGTSGVLSDRSDIAYESPCFGSSSGISKQIDFEKDFWVQIAFICATDDGRWPYIPPPTAAQCGPAVDWYDNVWSQPVQVKVAAPPQTTPTPPSSPGVSSHQGVAAFAGTYVGRASYSVTTPPHGTTPKKTTHWFKQLRFSVSAGGAVSGDISGGVAEGAVGSTGSAQGKYTLPGWTCSISANFRSAADGSASATGRIVSCVGGLKGTTVTGTFVARRI